MGKGEEIHDGDEWATRKERTEEEVIFPLQLCLALAVF